ncbi:predicted protein [Naegleria gruberi]|uniref:Predicted protein n=1 Tax=Naegleria gruberi TaxID=5762 RepID=D2VS03_NAEGR|nr:uncharacterized protein NAEGRDRAFT_71766 [Naegleria gruberi]EFC40335.1 predicted protein [Naegleria gruberi]|eukprot:XP_002673079.1 predicted protein [Naegleria gruberi strain NEG-M]
MKSIIFLIATLLLACFVYRAESALRATYWYQGTTCSGTSFLMTIRDNAAGCNVTSCTPYSNEPTVLSQSFECPTSYPQNPTLKSGEISIYAYSNTTTCDSTTLNRYDVYKTNVCIKSGILFGPSAKSGQYVNCEKVVTYSDENCQTVSTSAPITLNSCASGKINKCLLSSNSTTNAGNSMRHSQSIVSLVVLMIVGLIAVASLF